jgi:hypothetical protein
MGLAEGLTKREGWVGVDPDFAGGIPGGNFGSSTSGSNLQTALHFTLYNLKKFNTRQYCVV